MFDPEFVRQRITQLRLEKGVSEYQMSYDLGHSRSYVYNISSGRALPPMREFLQICDYFQITPAQFFQPSAHTSPRREALERELDRLDEEDLELVLCMAKRLGQKGCEGPDPGRLSAGNAGKEKGSAD